MQYIFITLAVIIFAGGAGVIFMQGIGEQMDETVRTGESEGESVGVQDEDGGDGDDISHRTPVASGRTIDISGRGLTQVPVGVFAEIDTEVLDVSNNELDGALPAEVGHLQNLHVLNLSNNNFTGVPAEVGKLSKLEELNLSGNPITGLPYELGNLKNLQILDLRGTNYAQQDLEIIRQGLSSDVVILVD